jgi:hypothetical protein
MNSDIIYVLDKGGVAEKGKFKDLSMFKNHHHELDHEDFKPQNQNNNLQKTKHPLSNPNPQ